MQGIFSTGESPPHILLVDPDPMIRVVFGDALRELGYTVTTAASPPSPNTDPQPGPAIPDLLIIDAKIATESPLPTLLLTHTQTPIPPPHSLPKPFRLPSLLTAITQLLPKPRSAWRGDRQVRPGALPLDPAGSGARLRATG